MNKTTSQNQAILNWLKQGHALTPLEALDRFGTLRLGGRIWDLRREGHKIKTETHVTALGKRVARYRLDTVEK